MEQVWTAGFFLLYFSASDQNLFLPFFYKIPRKQEKTNHYRYRRFDIAVHRSILSLPEKSYYQFLVFTSADLCERIYFKILHGNTLPLSRFATSPLKGS